jgi:hypothetical protein
MYHYREILFDKLRDTLLVRAHDKIVTIRVQSVYALKRLQDPSDEKDPATVELLRTLVSDPSK